MLAFVEGITQTRAALTAVEILETAGKVSKPVGVLPWWRIGATPNSLASVTSLNSTELNSVLDSEDAVVVHVFSRNNSLSRLRHHVLERAAPFLPELKLYRFEMTSVGKFPDFHSMSSQEALGVFVANRGNVRRVEVDWTEPLAQVISERLSTRSWTQLLTQKLAQRNSRLSRAS
eukprot:c20084_g1_i4.p1 GENE.c20084_g1_i4~~c20084_g1_i4.p1  ORF type:complete len:175 (+),score=25.28 c20084_g1_i4:529-1053(+)